MELASPLARPLSRSRMNRTGVRRICTGFALHHEGNFNLLSLYRRSHRFGGPSTKYGELKMKASLIALFAACAVSSAGFALADDPGVNPPRVALADDPGVSPPRVALADDPGVNPPRLALADDPGVSPPRVALADDPGVSPPRSA
jgi:hypothetical protein